MTVEYGGENGEAIRVRGARVHNLRDVDVDLPRDRLVVLTGVSGSGKSSLAFDTLYAEGQRRYIESLSSYARQFLDQLERPDVDLIDGLPPTVAIDQCAGPANPRSTVATVTEIHDYLRVLYARTGIPHCPSCGLAIRRQTPEQMVAGALGLPEGRKVLVLAPLVRGRKGEHHDAFQAVRREGLLRVRVDGLVSELKDDPKLARTRPHDIEAVVDRLVVREGIRPRLAESIDLALKLGKGTVILSIQEGAGWEDRVLSVHFACPACGIGFEELEPRTFSFNSPYGACPACDGLGVTSSFDPELVIPDRARSLADGAVRPWEGAKGRDAFTHLPELVPFLKRHRLKAETPLAKWSAKMLALLLEGEPGEGFPGVLARFEQEFQAATTERRRAALAAFRTEVPCPACDGARLRPEARAVILAERSIHDVQALAITASRSFFASLTFEPPLDQVGPPLVREIVNRLAFLERVGLGYLSLDRPADTLSGGELQRVRLATQIGSGLVGVCYVLDEPTAGLHPRDTDRLLDSLRDLRDQGNSIVVVEHDEATIRASDWLIDLGPGAGPDGGRIVATGPPNALSASPESLTARYLRREVGHGVLKTRPSMGATAGSLEPGAAGSGPLPPCGGGLGRGVASAAAAGPNPPPQPSPTRGDGAGAHGAHGEQRGTKRGSSTPLGASPSPSGGRLASSPGRLTVAGAAEHNLKRIDVAIPLAALTCVTGVSGSGKSTLVNEILARAVRRALERTGPRPGLHERLDGLESIDKLIEVDQSPIGRGPRSTPSTYTGVFDEIRKVFALTREAKIRGYGPNRFSFNVKGGRCEACQGQGVRRVEMQFLADLYVVCDTCRGQRFNRQTLEVRFKGKSIGDVLDQRVDDARAFFDAQPRVRRGLDALHEAGLGYVTLGQSSTTLSGGEAQRVKLAAELGRVDTGRTLYILDEPTTGLHFADVARLLTVLHRLADLGNTLVVIEHNLDVIRTADWVIDLGPEGGDDGGQLVAMGSPQAVAEVKTSYTGNYLKRLATKKEE